MIEPHGGKLINKVLVDASQYLTSDFYKINVPYRYLSDCEMISIGAYSPVEGFMTEEEVLSVLENVCLPNGIVWSIPIVLPLQNKFAANISIGDEIILCEEDKPIAVVKVTEKYTLDKSYYCKKVFKTTDHNHPGVKWFMEASDVFVAGEVFLINRPTRVVDKNYYLDPKDVREEISKRGWKEVVAFQTRNPIHRAHEYLIKCALEMVDGALIHPVVGETKPDDIPADVRMKCYEVLIDNYFNKSRVLLSVLPYSMRYAGPREALHHMIIRQNYGCTHMIIGRDHAGVGNYYSTYEAQEFVDKFGNGLKIKPIKFENAFYCNVCESMATVKTCPHDKKYHIFLSGTGVRKMLAKSKCLPENFTRKEVAEVLLESIRYI